MSSTLGLQELLKASFNDSIVAVNETAPYTTIQNRAKVTRSLKAVAGNERVMVRSVNKLNLEFGPNGEQVFEADNKDSRIRFVGSGWAGQTATAGTLIFTTTVNDFVEITFYGTGLNIVSSFDITTRDIKVSIDGGVEGSNIQPSTASAVLAGRYTSANQIMNITSNLSLGLHTIKFRNNSINGFALYGFEVLNQRSDVGVYPGTAIADGNIVGLSSLTSSSFKDGIVGTRGGRVVKYLDGTTIKSAAQEVDSSSKYLTLADHTNEEVIRRINFREFGAGRADDFSTLSGTAGSARAFTLDDGTTTLTGNNLYQYSSPFDSLSLATNANAFYTLTFVGTGLDIIAGYTNTGTFDTLTVSVDGGSVQTLLSGTITNTSAQIYKVVSGLPYGTHTIKFAYGVGGTNRAVVSDFIIYQPKKPSIPDGTIEIADYNVMADFVASSSPVLGYIGSGVLRKALSVREAIYTGTWTIQSGVDVTNFEAAINNTATATGSTITYSFYGTGFEWRGYCGANLTNSTISVDSSSNLSGFTTSFAQSSSGLTFTSSTGVLTGTSAAANRIKIQVSGLTLGWHTIKWTTNSAINFYSDILDIITPIHINSLDLKTGSLSLKSNTTLSPVIPNTTKWQRKILQSNINSSAQTVWTFNNLIVGKTYRFVAQIHWVVSASNYSQYYTVLSGSNTVGYLLVDPNATAAQRGINHVVVPAFVATSTTLTVTYSGSGYSAGDGIDTSSDCWASLEELPNHVQTFEW
jgi:hypothetical protein